MLICFSFLFCTVVGLYSCHLSLLWKALGGNSFIFWQHLIYFLLSHVFDDLFLVSAPIIHQVAQTCSWCAIMSENGSHQHNSNSNHQNHDINYKFTPQKLDVQQRREAGDNHKMISIVFLSLLVDLLAFTMILPLLPSLLDYYAQHDKVTFPITIKFVFLLLCHVCIDFLICSLQPANWIMPQ